MPRRYTEKIEARPSDPTTYADEFTDTFTAHEFVRDAPPDFAPAIGYLYRFFGHTGELLYVGRTKNPRSRMTNHMRDPRWYRRIARVEWEEFNSEDLARAEKDAIRTELPLENIVFKPKGPTK